MPLTRPIVLVYQEYATLTVAPTTPDLNCLIVGPAYYIQDYETDKTHLDVGEFVKSGKTKDSACDSAGDSLGRPDPGADFLVLAEPPNITSAPGAILDADSVEVVFDEALIQIHKGTDGTCSELSGHNEFNSATGGFLTSPVLPGDRIVMTKNGTGLDANTVVKTIKEVVTGGTQLLLTSTFKDAEITALGGTPGTVAPTNVDFRIEHQLDDQVIDDAYYSVSGQEITIKTGADGLKLAYGSTTYVVNYAAGMYVGYRALRQDLQDVLAIDSVTALTASKIGRVDERNPLAVGVYVALQNTGTAVQAFGVATDDLTGQTSARDRITTRDDIYAIVPVTGSITGVDWISVITMWKTHCAAYADPLKSKFRVVIGSYDTLPTEKSSVAPSDEGYTLEDATETNHSMFIDPAAATDFVGSEVGSAHLLDTTKNSDAFTDLVTLDNQKTIFSSGYAGAKALLGAVGKKRIRTTTGDAFTTRRIDKTLSYAVRDPILKSELVAASAIKADATTCAWGSDGGGTPKGRITKTGAFVNVQVGDIAHVSAGATPAHNDGFIVFARTDDTIDLETTDVTADTVTVQVYRPVASKNLGSITGASRMLTTTSSGFAAVAVGDIAYVLQSATAANQGMWIVSTKVDNNNVIVAPTNGFSMTDDTGGVNVAFFRSVSANGAATISVRKRLTRLRDDSQTFITTVAVGENIEIPYPADTDPTKWDTTTTKWPIKTIVSNELLDATLTELQELAPKLFKEGFNGDCSYRISIDLNRDAQVTELNTIPAGLKSNRCVMCWPNEVYVSGVKNEKTGTQNKQSGQYLACAVGGMTAGLPSHQGFTFIGIGGIQQLFNSNFYFTDDHIDDLSEAGWYVFLQDSESSTPYSAHEVTTDTDTYEMGEYMNVKNFDFVASYYRDIFRTFLGRYNITKETIGMLRDAFNNGTEFLQLRTYPRIGAPLLDATVVSVEQLESEVDRVEIYATVNLPKVLNKIGLHLRA